MRDHQGERILFIAQDVFQKPGIINGILGDIIFTDQNVYYVARLEGEHVKKGMYIDRDGVQSPCSISYCVSLMTQVKRHAWSRAYSVQDLESVESNNETIRIVPKNGDTMTLSYPRSVPSVVLAINAYPDSSQLYDSDEDSLGYYLALPKIDVLLRDIEDGRELKGIETLKSTECRENRRYIRSLYLNMVECENVQMIAERLQEEAADTLKLAAAHAGDYLGDWQWQVRWGPVIAVIGPLLSGLGAYLSFRGGEVLLGILCGVLTPLSLFLGVIAYQDGAKKARGARILNRVGRCAKPS